MLATPYTKMSFPTLNPARISGNFETTRPLGKQQWANLTGWSARQIMISQSFKFDELLANIQHDDVTIRRAFQREWTTMLQRAAFTTKDSNREESYNGPTLEKFRKAKCGPKYSHIRLIDLTQILIDHRIKVMEWYAEQKSRMRVKTEFDLRIEAYNDARWRRKKALVVQYKLPEDEVIKRMLEWDETNPKPTRVVQAQAAEPDIEPELVIEPVEVDDWEQLE
jgi:hypothetical protein